jgi:hypothetical protein
VSPKFPPGIFPDASKQTERGFEVGAIGGHAIPCAAGRVVREGGLVCGEARRNLGYGWVQLSVLLQKFPGTPLEIHARPQFPFSLRMSNPGIRHEIAWPA